jgi:hypothetical protein
MDEEKVKILLRGSENDEVETLWATPQGNHRYKLDNSPFYAYGVSWEDIVEVEHAEDGMLEFTRCIEKSGNRTVRVIFESPFEHPESKSVLERISHIGCSFEGMAPYLISINVPADVDFAKVTAYLTSLTNVKWEYADPTYEEVTGDKS